MAYQHLWLFNAKATHPEEQQWYYLTQSWENKAVHIFPKSICPKGNIIAWLEFEHTYYDFAVHRFKHYTTRTLPRIKAFIPFPRVLCEMQLALSRIWSHVTVSIFFVDNTYTIINYINPHIKLTIIGNWQFFVSAFIRPT